MTVTSVSQLKQRLAERTGLDAALLDRPGISDFVGRQCAAHGLPDEAAYYACAMEDATELEQLVKEVAVAETWFFRYPSSFELLRDCVGQLLQRRETLRMLSIACATGEEPYGMAMAAAAAGWPLERIVVDALDRNEASLIVARAGIYRGKSFRETIPQWAHKWFFWKDDLAQVDPALATRVTFHCQDVLQRPRSGRAPKYDVVFCRNVLIYLNAAARAALSEYLAHALAPEGLLFVGHAEQAAVPGERFESAGVKQSFAMRKKQPKSATANQSPGSRRAPATVRERAIQSADKARPPAPPAVGPQVRASNEDMLCQARAMADAGQLEAAVAALEPILAEPEAHCEVFELLGSIHLSSGRLEEARQAFNKALYFDPNRETALLQMAIVCDRLGYATLAARYRRRAVRVHNEESRHPT
jgi:chemotaxis protein methyltransferase WspC